MYLALHLALFVLALGGPRACQVGTPLHQAFLQRPDLHETPGDDTPNKPYDTSCRT